MSATNDNGRLEMFCDGVIAIAITLLIIEIKVPPIDRVHSVADLWHELGHLWTSYVAFVLSFGIILIAWVNHHTLFKLLDKTSMPFMYANGFFLMTIVVIPFATAVMAEYINTPYAQPAIVFYSFCSILHSFGWLVFIQAALKPKDLTRDAKSRAELLSGRGKIAWGLAVYAINFIISWWLPFVALGVLCVLWFIWIILGVTYTKKVHE